MSSENANKVGQAVRREGQEELTGLAKTTRSHKRINHVFTPVTRMLKLVWRNPMGKFGLIIIGVLGAVALFGPFLIPIDPLKQNLRYANTAPSWLGGDQGGLLGTDAFGRDLATRIVYGLRISVVFGLLTATGAAATGLVLGLLGGYYDRTVGRVLMRLADIQFSVPFLAVGLALVAVIGPGLWKLSGVLAVWAWSGFGRTIFASVMQVKVADHITAIRSAGASHFRIIIRHIMPNVIGPVIVLWSTIAGVLILAESALSLLGLGVQPPDFSLGSLLADSKTSLRIAWWAAVFPGVAIGMAVVGFSLSGDALRDALATSGTSKQFDPDLG